MLFLLRKPRMYLAAVVAVVTLLQQQRSFSQALLVAPQSILPARPTTTTSLAESSISSPPPLSSSSSSSSLDFEDSWSLIVLGDLHLEDGMTFHEQARQDCLDVARELSVPVGGNKTVRDVLPEILNSRLAKDLSLEELKLLLAYKQQQQQQQQQVPNVLFNTFLCSLGDLGRKDIRHEPGDAGTTKSFVDAKAFLDGFDGLPLELVSGNHDLEGLDEFKTDLENLQALMSVFGKPTPQFSRWLGEKTLLLGLSTVRFRDAPYSSHEVHIDDDQLQWFVDMVQRYPASKGYKILVMSHAPICGSGLRVLQNVHVTNGCAWLNHCSHQDTRNLFYRLCAEHAQIKLWCSGHFHLSHDFQDSLASNTVGSCTFVQVGVMGPASTRDGKRQTRLIQGCRDWIRIFTIQHHQRHPITNKAMYRLDTEIDMTTDTTHPSNFTRPPDGVDEHDDWFKAYTPRKDDGCYIEMPDGSICDMADYTNGGKTSKVCWWHMKDGRVLGLHPGGQLVEYDAMTLSPLGIVVHPKDMAGKNVVAVDQGTVLALVEEATGHVQVIHPNEDGSYWRKFQSNKKIRMEEKAREALVQSWIKQQQKLQKQEQQQSQ